MQRFSAQRFATFDGGYVRLRLANKGGELGL